MQFSHTPKPTRSIWGKVQHAEEVAAGIWSVSTPGHGGLILSKERNAMIQKVVKAKTWMQEGMRGNYEEDCDFAIPCIQFRDEFEKFYISKGVCEGDISRLMFNCEQESKRIASK